LTFKKLINTRNNARVSIAASIPSGENLDGNKQTLKKTRRSSLPSTQIEIIQAQLSAGNLDSIISRIKPKNFYQPNQTPIYLKRK
jgi:hypothetical protein